MLRFVTTFGVVASMFLSGWASSAHAIGLLLPAIQKVRDAAAKDCNPYITIDYAQDADELPVLMVISNQDFYHLEIFDTQFIGSGKDTKVVLTGLAEVGSADSKETQTCFSVVTLSADPQNPDHLQIEIETKDEHGRQIWLEVFTCPDDDSFAVTLEYLVLMT